MATYNSPNSRYSLNTYLYSGNATVSYAVRGELIDKKTGRKKNIYWDYRVDTADVRWITESQVEINGHIIDIPNGKYDFRRD